MNKHPLIFNVISTGLVSRRIQQVCNFSDRKEEDRYTHTAVLCPDYSDRINNSWVVIESHFDGYKGQNGVVKVPIQDWFQIANKKGQKVFGFEYKNLDVGRINAFAELRARYDIINIFKHRLASISGISKFEDSSRDRVYCTELVALCDNWNICKTLKLKPHEITPEHIFNFTTLNNLEITDYTGFKGQEIEDLIYG